MSQPGTARIQFALLRTASLRLAEDVVLLASSKAYFQQPLWRLRAGFEVAGMRISTFKYESMLFGCKKVGYPIWVRRELLPQVEEVEEFKYL